MCFFHFFSWPQTDQPPQTPWQSRVATWPLWCCTKCCPDATALGCCQGHLRPNRASTKLGISCMGVWLQYITIIYHILIYNHYIDINLEINLEFHGWVSKLIKIVCLFVSVIVCWLFKMVWMTLVSKSLAEHARWIQIHNSYHPIGCIYHRTASSGCLHFHTAWAIVLPHTLASSVLLLKALLLFFLLSQLSQPFLPALFLLLWGKRRLLPRLPVITNGERPLRPPPPPHSYSQNLHKNSRCKPCMTLALMYRTGSCPAHPSNGHDGVEDRHRTPICHLPKVPHGDMFMVAGFGPSKGTLWEPLHAQRSPWLPKARRGKWFYPHMFCSPVWQP